MLLVFPFLAWLAAFVSAGLLVALWLCEDLGRAALALLGTWFVVAAYCQFFAASALVAALGVGGQTVLAIYLIVRWRLAA